MEVSSAITAGGWFANAWHDWDSFGPRCNWRDFCLLHIGGEWNGMTGRWEIEVALLGAMAGLALLLSALGIFALVANLVVQRTREIGIRIALGSSVRNAMLHIGAPGVRAAALGLGAGLMLSAAALRVMRSVLYGVTVYDPATLVVAVLTLAAVVLMAAGVPTIRVARIDPATTLRED